MANPNPNPNDNPHDWSQFYNNQSFLTTSTTAMATTTDSRLSPEGGRVSKPARRRSRASRRTPTTLLNTDTSNFRAMVQQFTGGPSSMASSGFSLTSSSSEPYVASGGQQIPSWQYNFQNQQQQQRPYMFALNNVVVGFDNMMNPNTVVPGVFGAVDGGGREGGGAAPATEEMKNNTCSSSSSSRLR